MVMFDSKHLIETCSTMQHTKVWNGSFHVNHGSCLMLAAMWKIHWCSLLHTRVCLWIFSWPVGIGSLWSLGSLVLRFQVEYVFF